MSITSSDFSRTYAGDGSALSCPFPLAFWDEAELKVVQVAADGTETALVLDTDYTLGGGVTENGIVTYPSGCAIAYPKAGSGLSNLPVGENLFAYVEVGFTQPTDFVNYSFDKDLLEKELDRACRRDMYLKRQYDLTVRYPISTDPAGVQDAATYLSTVEGYKSAAEMAKAAAETAETNAETAETAAETAQVAAEAAAAGLSLPSLVAADAAKMLQVKSDGSGWELAPWQVAVNALAGGADHTSSGVIAALTAGEALVFGDFCYMKSDGKWWKADADAAVTMPGAAMALEPLDADDPGEFLLFGYARDDSWGWTVGGLIYVSTTGGALTQTAPSGSGDQVQVVGVATHATRMLFAPDKTLVEIA